MRCKRGITLAQIKCCGKPMLACTTREAHWYVSSICCWLKVLGSTQPTSADSACGARFCAFACGADKSSGLEALMPDAYVGLP